MIIIDYIMIINYWIVMWQIIKSCANININNYSLYNIIIPCLQFGYNIYIYIIILYMYLLTSTVT